MLLLKTKNKNFKASFMSMRNRGGELASDIEATVREILEQVRKSGDKELIRLTEKYDGHKNIKVSVKSIHNAYKKINPRLYASLKLAYKRIESFHKKQLQNSWIQTEESGEILGQIVRPLEKIGIYVPGGKAVYPTSVLMNAIPARVAGVKEIIMVTPGSSEGIRPIILAAAELCGITKIFQIGGAQAIAALAYGTETVPKVDKIVGPGNIYVATAKKLVYGNVAIDMIAGPSEVLVISDGTGDPAWVAGDMLSQAEHDEMASSILITTDEAFAAKVNKELQLQLERLPKRQIAKKSIDAYGAIIIAQSLHEAIDLANDVAPEHLELYVKNPWELLPGVKNAGAVFMGYYSPEPVGDYIAGPNHVLPTGGSARFFSPLSVDDFLKKISLLSFTQEALNAVARDVIGLARAEELVAHARAVKNRLG
ncbi:MAG: histidinol dehydrogenase [Pseudomonadota bacterium]